MSRKSVTSQKISTARKLLFSMLSKLSAIDGKIEGDEIGYVLDLLDSAADDREACILAYSKARRSRRGLLDYADDFAALELSERHRAEAYDKLWRVAVSDHLLRAPEKFLLRDVCVKLRLPPSVFEDSYVRYHPTFADEELNEGCSTL